MGEFWDPAITAKSFELLQQLQKRYDFVLIGGWAIYLYARTYKSKDVDIIVDYGTIAQLKNDFRNRLTKNDRLKKYNVKTEFCDVDIYVPFLSTSLVYPVERILREKKFTIVDGIKVVDLKVLLLFKQQAEIARRGSIKGKKDALDIASLLLNTNLTLNKYAGFLAENDKLSYLDHLHKALAGIDPQKDNKYLDVGFKVLVDKRKMLLAQVKKSKLKYHIRCPSCNKPLNSAQFHTWFTKDGKKRFYCKKALKK